MNYEQMIQRLIDGLTTIRTQVSNVEVVAHAYVIAVPAAYYEDYSEDQIADLKDWGWSWSDDMGWVLPVLA